MGLIIKKRFHQQRSQATIIVGVVGVVALIGAPLSYALTVRSPSKPVAKNVLTRLARGSGSAPAASKKGNTTVTSTVPTPLPPQSTDCATSTKTRSGLLSAKSPELKKLAQYEGACGSGIISQLSFFVPTPTTTQQAREDAADVIAQLREFAANGISPLVFFEPTTDSGLVSLSAYRAGAYDSSLDTYFATIKAAGITDSMMGTWVPLPEGNLPEWTSVDPADFVGSVTKAVTYQKKYFPGSKASIMLDTLTYPNANSWDGGKAVSLLPYVQTVPAGLIDSFGLQGFPWSPASNEGGPTNGRPKDYLRVDLAAEAAHALHVQSIWLNTGSFRVSYANQIGQVISSPDQRLSLLNEVAAQAKTLQSQGFNVAVHLFAEDKSRTSEAIDWSYWPTGRSDASASTYVFKAFAHELQAENVPLWLFDADE